MTEVDPSTVHEAATWDERYSGGESQWSGRVNHRLAEQAADLRPGAALEFGCGEGGDAVWLARRGWQVTATDVSAVVVERDRAHAAAALPAEVAARITWRTADMRSWQADEARYDLVSMQFVHPARDQLAGLFTRIASATRPGGTLLLVNHDPADMRASERMRHMADMMPTVEESVAALDPQQWQVAVAAVLARPDAGHGDHGDGRPRHTHDVVLRATRR